jgi:hypothetical protein
MLWYAPTKFVAMRHNFCMWPLVPFFKHSVVLKFLSLDVCDWPLLGLLLFHPPSPLHLWLGQKIVLHPDLPWPVSLKLLDLPPMKDLLP